MEQQAHYQAADAVMAQLPSESDLTMLVQKVHKQFSEQLYREIQTWFESYLIFDARFNVADHIRNVADSAVRALLLGDRDALERFALGDFHDAENVRKAIAQHCGDEVLTQRIKDLETQVEILQSCYSKRYGY